MGINSREQKPAIPNHSEWLQDKHNPLIIQLTFFIVTFLTVKGAVRKKKLP